MPVNTAPLESLVPRLGSIAETIRLRGDATAAKAASIQTADLALAKIVSAEVLAGFEPALQSIADGAAQEALASVVALEQFLGIVQAKP